jgi:hypothetical protein
MRQRDETYAPAHTDEELDADALERYRRQRIAEIRAGMSLPERGFVPLNRLKELADAEPGEGGALGP